MRYSSDPNGKVCTPLIRIYAGLVRVLVNIQENLSFTKLQMKQAMLIILELPEGPRVKPEHSEEWASEVAHRQRCMCRHVSNAMCRNPRPVWLGKILANDTSAAQESQSTTLADDAMDTKSADEAGERDEADDDGDESGAMEASNAEPEIVMSADSPKKYATGWGRELLTRTSSKTRSEREMSTNLFSNPGSDFLWADWGDGYVAEIVDITLKEFEARFCVLRPEALVFFRNGGRGVEGITI